LGRIVWTYLLLLTACSYGFSQGRLREGLHSVAVPFFENRSTQPNVEIELTEAVVAGLIADRTLRVVEEAQADAIVRGSLRRYDFVEAFFGEERSAEEYKVIIQLEVSMVDRRTQEVLAGPKQLTGEGRYLIEDGPAGEATARDLATKAIVEAILNMVIEEW
jgi:hypothetical protein